MMPTSALALPSTQTAKPNTEDRRSAKSWGMLEINSSHCCAGREWRRLMNISTQDMKTIRGPAERFGVGAVYLFGSSLASEGEPLAAAMPALYADLRAALGGR